MTLNHFHTQRRNAELLRQTREELNMTRIIEDVPGTRLSERWFLWQNRRVAKTFSTLRAATAFCQQNGIRIDRVEPHLQEKTG